MESRCLSLILVFLSHPLSLARVLKASVDKFSESFFAWSLSRPVSCLQLLHCPWFCPSMLPQQVVQISAVEDPKIRSDLNGRKYTKILIQDSKWPHSESRRAKVLHFKGDILLPRCQCLTTSTLIYSAIELDFPLPKQESTYLYYGHRYEVILQSHRFQA